MSSIRVMSDKKVKNFRMAGLWMTGLWSNTMATWCCGADNLWSKSSAINPNSITHCK